MELHELLPEKPEFTLRKTGKTYQLRAVNLEDQVWIKNKYGSAEALERVLTANDWENSLLMVYRLMTDKSDFMGSEEEIIDDDGRKQKAFVTGPVKLLREIQGAEEGALIMGALAKAIIISNPMIEKLVKERVDEQIKKKQSTGQNSLTSSPQNTDGQPSK